MKISCKIPVQERFLIQLQKDNSGCRLWTGATRGKNGNRYGVIKVNGKPKSAHRFAWELVNGPIPKGMKVCHRCDVPLCCEISHLFLDTQAGNVADAARKKRMGPTKLTEDQVNNIRQSQERQVVIAKRFGIDQSHVSKIKSKDRWKHL